MRILLLKPLTTMTLALLLTACGGETGIDEGGKAANVRGVTETEIIIGSQNDLSGPASIIGVAMINGARMKFDEVNDSGGIHGRKVRFVVEDAQYQVPRAIQAANKLINRDGIFFMMLSMGTPMNNAIMPMLFEKNIPNLFPATAARSMSEPFRRLQFTGLGTYYQQIRASVRYFVESGEASTPCVVYQDTDFGQEILEGAQDQVAEMGLELAAVSAHRPTDTEFTSAILRLRSAGCDLVLMGTIHKDTILVLEAARKMGWDEVRWAGTTASYINAVASMDSGASEGFSVFQHMAPIHRDDADIEPAIADWWDRYEERFGMEPDWGALEGYRSAEFVSWAMDLAGSNLTVDSLITAMESAGDYTDFFGVTSSYGPGDHSGANSAVLSVVKNGRWVGQSATVTYED